MITTLMFHRVHAENLPTIKVFEQFLSQICSWGYPCLPGQVPPKGQHAICLTFDDAYFDFYHLVFPLLKKYNLPAVLAIPTNLIADQIQLTPEVRLKKQFHQPLIDAIEPNPALCSWSEIDEMVSSKLVMPACHSATHAQLNQSVDLHHEVVDSKVILEEKTNREISTFVYPFGQFDKTTHAFVRQHYRYIMRIGSAINFNWQPRNGLIYRLNADNFWPNEINPFTWKRKAHSFGKLLANSLRGR